MLKKAIKTNFFMADKIFFIYMLSNNHKSMNILNKINK